MELWTVGTFNNMCQIVTVQCCSVVSRTNPLLKLSPVCLRALWADSEDSHSIRIEGHIECGRVVWIVHLFRVSIFDCSIECLLQEVHKNDVLSEATFCSFVRVLHTRNCSLNFD
jgi:hypothetical protein